MDVKKLSLSSNSKMKQAKIFYFCYDHQKPTGGQKQMYRHIDILNRNGYQAYILHTQKGFRLRWFENNTKVIDGEEFTKLYNKRTDYIVLPEDLGIRILAFPGRKIIFNQNIYYGFNSFGFNKINKWPYLDKNVKFVMIVSSHNQRYLQFIFPNVRIRRIYYGVNPKKFIYKSVEQKKKMITILPGKAPLDNNFLYQAISARAQQNYNMLKHYVWKMVGTYTESKMSRIFGQSTIFIFLSLYEGFGMMPLEAMLSGALVVAYKRGAYSEYLNSSNSFLVDASDKLGLVKKVEEIARKFGTESGRKKLAKISQNAYETAKRYSLEREEKSVLKFWDEVFHFGF